MYLKKLKKSQHRFYVLETAIKLCPSSTVISSTPPAVSASITPNSKKALDEEQDKLSLSLFDQDENDIDWMGTTQDINNEIKGSLCVKPIPASKKRYF